MKQNNFHNIQVAAMESPPLLLPSEVICKTPASFSPASLKDTSYTSNGTGDLRKKWSPQQLTITYNSSQSYFLFARTCEKLLIVQHHSFKKTVFTTYYNPGTALVSVVTRLNKAG
jgi:hypothetical protein